MSKREPKHMGEVMSDIAERYDKLTKTKMVSKLLLKRKLKNIYLQIQNYKVYDCGHKLMLTISSDYYNLVKSFNDVADKLSKIDKDCPKFRFELY